MLALRRVYTRIPRQMTRLYSNDTAGPQSTGSSDGFNRREKASEDWYIQKQEKDQLKKLHEEIAQREKEITELKEKANKYK